MKISKDQRLTEKKMIVCKSNEGKKAITEYFLEKNYFINKDTKINLYKCKLKQVGLIK